MADQLKEYLDNLVTNYLDDILEDLEVSPGSDLLNRCIGAAEAFRELGLIDEDLCMKYTGKYTDVYLATLEEADIFESGLDNSH